MMFTLLSGALGVPALVWWTDGSAVAMGLGGLLLATAAMLVRERERPSERRQLSTVAAPPEIRDQRLNDAA